MFGEEVLSSRFACLQTAEEGAMAGVSLGRSGRGALSARLIPKVKQSMVLNSNSSY